eukprot:gene19782-21720_t
MYSNFAHSLLTEKRELDGVLACGVMGKSINDGIEEEFKDNIKRELEDRIYCHRQANYYGRNIRQAASGKAEKWPQQEDYVYEWFKKEKGEDIKESMPRPVRTEAGLGDPPSEYTKNESEAGNFMIKHGLHFELKKIQEFIVQVKSIVDAQFRNEGRAVIGKGPFKVIPMFSYWCQTIEATSSVTAEPLSKIPKNNCKLSITASESGIKTIPPNILESMFTNPNQLLKKPGFVMPTPGANIGSFVVAAGKQQHPYSETSPRRAQKSQKWLCLEGIKNTGKKPSNRKRSNAKRSAVEQFIPLLEEDKYDDHEAVPQAAVSHAVSSKRRTLAVGPRKSGQSCTLVNSTMQMPCYSTQQFVMPPMAPVANYEQPQVQRQQVSTTPASAIWSIKWVAGINVSRCYGCGSQMITHHYQPLTT